MPGSRRAFLLMPGIGRAVGSDGIYREMALPVLNGLYVFSYGIMRDHIRVLRVFHSREQRDV